MRMLHDDISKNDDAGSSASLWSSARKIAEAWRTRRHTRRAATLKSPEEIEAIHRTGRVVREALEAAAAAATPGVTTGELNDVVVRAFTAHGAESLFRGYPHRARTDCGFPAESCISVNEEVVHGIPGDRVLQEGDLCTVDCGLRLDGWCADAAMPLAIGELDADRQRLRDATVAVLDEALQNICPGMMWSEVAQRMQQVAEEAGFGVVRDYLGHGIGRDLHESPQVPAFLTSEFLQRADFALEPGLVVAIEPMLTLGSPAVEVLDDGWTVVTGDGMASCHVEHTIAVSTDGVLILTDGS